MKRGSVSTSRSPQELPGLFVYWNIWINHHGLPANPPQWCVHSIINQLLVYLFPCIPVSYINLNHLPKSPKSRYLHKILPYHIPIIFPLYWKSHCHYIIAIILEIISLSYSQSPMILPFIPWKSTGDSAIDSVGGSQRPPAWRLRAGPSGLPPQPRRAAGEAAAETQRGDHWGYPAWLCQHSYGKWP